MSSLLFSPATDSFVLPATKKITITVINNKITTVINSSITTASNNTIITTTNIITSGAIIAPMIGADVTTIASINVYTFHL